MEITHDVSLLFTGGIVILALLLMILAIRHRSCYLATKSRARSRIASRGEAIVLGCVAVTCLLYQLMYRRRVLPYPLTEFAPAEVLVDLAWFIGGFVLVLGIAVYLCLRNHTVLATVGIVTCLIGVNGLIDSGAVLGERAYRNELREIPVPVTIEVADGIAGADVWFNDVHLGKTPLIIDARELFQEPQTLSGPGKSVDATELILKQQLLAAPGKSDERISDEYLNIHGRQYRRYQRLLLPYPHHLKEPRSTINSVDIEARVELNGKTMYAVYGSEAFSGAFSQGEIQPGFITLSFATADWIQNIHELFERARLVDFQVDSEWVDALSSYGETGWRLLRESALTDVQQRTLLESVAVHLYQVEEADNPETAWTIFQQICAEANEREMYSTHTPASVAVEVLIPKINPEHLVAAFMERLPKMQLHNVLRVNNSFPSPDETLFQYQDSRFISDDGERSLPADYVLAHAVWRMDERLDELDPLHDNLIEETIVPQLLRLQFSRGHLFQYSFWLGGSQLDQFVLRHDLSEGFDSLRDRITNGMHIGGTDINQWFYYALWLDSPAGDEFRWRQRSRVQDVAEKQVAEPMPRVDTIEFLFLNERNGNPYLAEEFWPTVMRAHLSRPHQFEMLSFRWEYLLRMRPYSTAEQFVAAYKSYQKDSLNGLHLEILSQLEPDFQWTAIMELIEANSDKFSRPEEARLAKTNETMLLASLWRIPLPAAAQTLQEYLREGEGLNERLKTVERSLRNKPYPDPQIEMLATSDRAELQQLALVAIECFPSVARRELLDRLTASTHETVATQAQKLHSQFQAMLTSPLPVRTFPVSSGEGL